MQVLGGSNFTQQAASEDPIAAPTVSWLLWQVVQEAERADLSDEDGNYPARAYATLDLLERQLLGLRQQLCQVTPMRTFYF